jgi:esterase/lipase superfamily enzyme
MVPRSAADAVSPNPAELPPRAATSDTAESRATATAPPPVATAPPVVATAPPVEATAPPVEATSPPVDRGPFESLPAGATRDATDRYAKIPVYYATDRQRASLPLSAYALEGNRDAVVLLAGSAIVFLALALFNLVRRRVPAASAFGAIAFAASLGLTATIWSGTAAIEKHGVTYTGQRGSLVKGLCEVTVPDTHRRGRVERPSWLRFEFREDQREHIVLTRATELSDDRFYDRLGETIALSPENDLLVFVHGYNVDFESAVRRTAQLAVDLPFEGVPVCYSWPSRGNVLSYTIDEANAAWTQSHLRAFLLELADRSGARAINVVAHSMGNRPTTGALVDIGWKQHANPDAAPTKLLDRLVLAAPDVDADLFRKDLAPALSRVADHVTLYASSDDRALVASKQVHGYPRAGESGDGIVVVPGIETVDVSGIDLSLLGHSYYGDSPSMLQELYELLRIGLPAAQRRLLRPRPLGDLTYWQLVPAAGEQQRAAFGVESGRR